LLQQGRRRAADDRALEVVYEPVVSLPDRGVVGAAALLRWSTPHRGILEHDEILAVADEAGLRPQLQDLLLDEVGARLTEAAHGSDRPVWISVGIGADDVGRPDLPGRLSAMLATARIPPRLLQIEVPEATVAEDRTAERLDGLLRLGVGLTVTGFGNGPSSLRHLAHYPAPAIEVDRSFVSGIGQRREDRLIIEAVGHLALELGLDLVGDGVSSQVQATHLESLGAARASGPVFGRPVPWDEFRRRHLARAVRR
jgi:EAL domain-containing protein (putative c-di-GMP-specific phosphodiesterase class I)